LKKIKKFKTCIMAHAFQLPEFPEDVNVAICDDDCDALQDLIDAGFDPLALYETDTGFETLTTYCLRLAAEFNAEKCARLLIAHGADPKRQCDTGELPHKWPGIAHEEEKEEEEDFYYLEYNSIQAANLAHGNLKIIDMLRGNRLVRQAFNSIRMPALKHKAYVVLLCAQRAESPLALLSKDVLHTIIGKMLRF
jgi:hypothetical protein